MRAIVQNQPGHAANQGVVVFHIGGNVARRWNDFRQFSEADQGYFADLLPEAEEVPFTGDTVEREPGAGGRLAPVEFSKNVMFMPLIWIQLAIPTQRLMFSMGRYGRRSGSSCARNSPTTADADASGSPRGGRQRLE